MFFRSIVIGLLFISSGNSLSAQMFENQEQVSFGTRINAPISVKVEQTGNTLVFYAENKSYYPYYFELSFTKLVNLIPRIADEKRVLKHGTTRVLKLTIENEEQSPDYAYSIRYKMGDPSKKVDENFAYLIPLNAGKKVERHLTSEGNSIRYFINAFKVQPGDTIYAMRKGFVVSLPNNKQPTDNLMPGSIEIIHEDGTVATYTNISDPLVSYDEVFPGAPIGIANKTEFIVVKVFSLSEDRVRVLENQFVVDETTNVNFRNLVPGSLTQHPISILEKELSPKELKKFRKSKK